MADNLSISITADVSSLQAQLAIARAEVAAYGREVRQAAGAVVGGDASQLANLEQFAAKLGTARGEVASLSKELKGAGESGGVFGGIQAGVAGLQAGVAGAIGGVRELAGVLGVAFGAEALVEGVVRIAEMGERIENVSASVGVAPERFARLQGALQLVGGDADLAGRALLMLEKNMLAALESPKGTQALNFQAWGIGPEQLRKGLEDVQAFIEGPLADAYKKFVTDSANPGVGAAEFRVMAGRMSQELVPALKEGSASLKELEDTARRIGLAPTAEQIKTLAEEARSINELKGAFQGLGITIVTEFKDPIIQATKALEEFIKTAGGGGLGTMFRDFFNIQEIRDNFAKIGDTFKQIDDWIRTHSGVGAKLVPPEWTQEHPFLGGSGDTSGRREGSPFGALEGGRSSGGFNPTPEEQALLDRIKQHESGGQYDLLHGPGGRHISDLSAFPQWEGFMGPGGLSHAAGGYGFQPGTYAEMAAITGRSDFSAQAQDINALALLRQRGTAPWPWLAAEGGEGGKTVTPAPFPYKERNEELTRELKALEEWAKIESAGYDVGIQKAKQNEQEATGLEQQKIAMLERTAEQAQAIRNRYADEAKAAGADKIADQFRTGGDPLQLKALESEKQLIALQQRSAEQAAAAAIKTEEAERRADQQKETTQLQAVERRRQLGEITAAEAADQEIRIVEFHRAQTERILDDEAKRAAGIEKLATDVASRRIEAEARADEQIQRIRDKADQEERQRAQAIDKELAGSLSQGIVGAAWGKQSPGQAIGSFVERQETKALDTVLTKALDASGIGKIFDQIGEKITSSLFGSAANAGIGAATQTAPIVTAITGQTAAVTGAVTAGDATVVGAVTAGDASVVAAIGTLTAIQSAELAKPSILGTTFDAGGIVSAAGGLLVDGSGHVADGKGGQMIIAHPNEAVLPAKWTLGLEQLMGGRGQWSIPTAPAPSAITTAASGGGARDMNFHYAPTVNAPAAPDLKRLISRQGNDLLTWLNAQARSGALRMPA